jgi:hypothetical protein
MPNASVSFFKGYKGRRTALFGACLCSIAFFVSVLNGSDAEEDDVIRRLDRESRQNTSANEWKRSGMIEKG